MGDLDTLSEIFKRDSNSNFSRELAAAARQVLSLLEQAIQNNTYIILITAKRGRHAFF